MRVRKCDGKNAIILDDCIYNNIIMTCRVHLLRLVRGVEVFSPRSLYIICYGIPLRLVETVSSKQWNAAERNIYYYILLRFFVVLEIINDFVILNTARHALPIVTLCLYRSIIIVCCTRVMRTITIIL